MQVCKRCDSVDSTKKVYDFSTHTCIAEGGGCPTKTVMTTLDQLTKESSAEAMTVTGDHSMIKVCAVCNKRCETCPADDVNKCLTCNSDFYSNTYTWTDQSGQTMTHLACKGNCMVGKYAADDATKI